MAKLSGAGWVGVVGLKQDVPRLAISKKLGADRNIVVGEDDALEVVRSRGDGLGVDAVIDAAGVSEALKLAMAAVRPGGQITKVGWGPQPLNFSLDPLVQKAARIQGSFSHNFPIWERVIDLFATGKLDPAPLVGRVEPLANWRACFDEMASGKIVKAVLKP
jgi:alcohol dehydrogenase/L-iditol 2-dehydrogenase